MPLKTIYRLIVVGLLLLTSCKSERAKKMADVAASEASAPATLAARTTDASQQTAVAADVRPAFPRMVMRNAVVSLVVQEPSVAAAKVIELASRHRGFISGSREWKEGGQTRASVTLRVPGEELDGVLRQLREIARRVESETVSSEDVSQEYVDLKSRLRNLEATEAELLQLLRTIRERSQKASEVLAIHAEVTRIRGEIEMIRGRANYLEQMTAYSTIQIQLLPDVVEAPIVARRWTPLEPVYAATRALVATLQMMSTAVIWFVVYVLPVTGIIGIALLGLWRLRRVLAPTP